VGILRCGGRATDRFGKAYLLVAPTPPPVGAIGIIDLGEFRDLIYGLQSLRGKILSRKELQSEVESRGLRQYRGREFLSQGWMNMNAVLFCAKREGQGSGL
jgi:hypothetical protein